jgi:diacylglycerol O-acyltransferase
MAGSITRVPVPDLCTLWAETPATPMNIALMGVLHQGDMAGAANGDDWAVLEQVRGAIEANLHRAPLLRRRLLRTRLGEGTAVWVDASGFDISRHVVLAPPQPGVMDEDSFLTWCATRSLIPLDRAFPLWRMDVAPRLPGGRVGVLLVLHHVVADGLRGVELVSSLLDPAPGGHRTPALPWRPEPLPTSPQLIRDNLRRRIRAARRARPGRLLRSLRSLQALARQPEGPAPVTSLTGGIGPGRRLIVLRFPLEDLRRTAHRHGCTINELLLAGVTQGARALLAARGECTPGLVLRASVPVGARRGRSGGMIIAPLPVGIADADERLRLIIEATRGQKEHPDQGVAGIVSMPAAFARLGVLWARHAAAAHINLYVTNVPGPPRPLYLAGARLLEAVPLAPLVAGVRLSVTALSYDGELRVSVLGDDTLDDLPVLADGVRSTLSRAEARLPVAPALS